MVGSSSALLLRDAAWPIHVPRNLSFSLFSRATWTFAELPWIRFGQRYHKASDSSDVAITHQRTPASTVTGELDCIICTDSKGVDAFPRFSITSSCTHAPHTCLECIQLSIESDLSSKLWTNIRCPECRELLEYSDIQRYANKQSFLR